MLRVFLYREAKKGSGAESACGERVIVCFFNCKILQQKYIHADRNDLVERKVFSWEKELGSSTLVTERNMDSSVTVTAMGRKYMAQIPTC